MKRYHDHGNSYKGHFTVEVGLAYSSRGLIHCHGSMVASRQTWCWRSQEFYIAICRQQGEDCPLKTDRRRLWFQPHWVGLDHRRPQSPPTQWHKAMPTPIRSHLIVPLSVSKHWTQESMGPKAIQTTSKRKKSNSANSTWIFKLDLKLS